MEEKRGDNNRQTINPSGHFIFIAPRSSGLLSSLLWDLAEASKAENPARSCKNPSRSRIIKIRQRTPNALEAARRFSPSLT